MSSQYAEVAVQIAREAGELLLSYLSQRIGFELKGDADLVTEADRASEALVVRHLKANFPTHTVVAEEGGGYTGSSGYRWYVDPLDGTTNFAHAYPAFNVTLALEHEGEIIAGVIFDPNRNEMFSAERGSGSWLNGERIRVSSVERLEDGLFATGFPSRNRQTNVNIHFYHQLAMITHGVRRSGSAAIDLANVACGRLEGFWEFGLQPWDLAAGTLLVSEAGGTCTGMNGSLLNVHGPDLLTDNGLLHGQILALFGEIFQGQFRHAIPPIFP